MSAPKSHNAAFLALVNDAKSRIREIDIDAYQRLRAAREEHVLIDTREDNEWGAGHAAGAIHLGKGIIERDIEARVPAKGCQAGALLRRRIPVGVGRGCFAEDGLHECDLAGWRMALVSAIGFANRKITRSSQRPLAYEHAGREV